MYTVLLFCGQTTGPGIMAPVKLGVGDTFVDVGVVEVVDVGVVDVGDSDDEESAPKSTAAELPPTPTLFLVPSPTPNPTATATTNRNKLIASTM